MKNCVECGVEFRPYAARSKFCSRRCSSRYWRSREHGECVEDGCDRPVRAKNRCASHYTMWQRKETDYFRWTEYGPMRSNLQRLNDSNKNHKRRLRINETEVEKINIFVIAARDNWICGICEKEIDSALKYPDPQSKSLDHITALSLGGTHTLDNVRIAHLSCNTIRGNRS